MEPEKSKIQQVEKRRTSSSLSPRRSRRKIWNSWRSPKRVEVLEWACDFLFSGTKVAPHAVFVKGRFTLRVKKSPVLASLVRYFLPFALDKYSVLRWQVFRKKEKNVVLWWVFVLSFCYRDLSAWWENRTDQPSTQYHFVTTSKAISDCFWWISLLFW